MIKITQSSIRARYLVKYNITSLIGEEITSLLELVQFEKGEHICHADEPLDYLFFFVKGKAKVYTTMNNGKSLLLFFYTPMKILGEVEFIRNQKAKSSVQCMEESYCLALPTTYTRQQLKNDATFLGYLCKELAKKLDFISVNSSMNILYPLENRLAYYIKSSLEPEATVFEENLTPLAELLGTSYRHLLRTLNTLCEKGVLNKEKRGYQVTNFPLLNELAIELEE